MDRGRDRRYDEDRGYGGESYRPSEHSSQARSNYRGYGSPPRRGRTPPQHAERYGPGADRRRSRSPPYGGRGEANFRRPRSPATRGFSPRRDERARSPPARARRRSRSPIRARSPAPPRRDPSPYERRPRSPPPLRKSRAPSPRDRYERRPYSPPREPKSRYPEENNYRPRARSRSPPPRRQEHLSRVASPTSSRRSSPPIHPDRLAQTDSRPRSPAYRESRPPVGPRELTHRERSPLPRKPYSPAARSPSRQSVYHRSPPRRERKDFDDAKTIKRYTESPGPVHMSSTYRNGDSRPPPTGPSGSYKLHAREAPSATASSAQISISAHNRPDSTSILSAPTRPRGGASVARADSRDYSFGGPPPHRGGRPPSAAPYHGPPRQPYDSRAASTDYIPNGPRSSHGGPPSSSYEPPRHIPSFRPNNSSSTTYPRTQRFATNHLASLPTIVPGGKALPSADPAAAKKINQLEEDAEKLRKQIEDRQKEKRVGLKEWETRERESRREGLRSELAEAQLEGLSGEVIGGTAF